MTPKPFFSMTPKHTKLLLRSCPVLSSPIPNIVITSHCSYALSSLALPLPFPPVRASISFSSNDEATEVFPDIVEMAIVLSSRKVCVVIDVVCVSGSGSSVFR